MKSSRTSNGTKAATKTRSTVVKSYLRRKTEKIFALISSCSYLPLRPAHQPDRSESLMELGRKIPHRLIVDSSKSLLLWGYFYVKIFGGYKLDKKLCNF